LKGLGVLGGFGHHHRKSQIRGMVSTNIIIRCLMAMLAFLQDQNNFLMDVEKTN